MPLPVACGPVLDCALVRRSRSVPAVECFCAFFRLRSLVTRGVSPIFGNYVIRYYIQFMVNPWFCDWVSVSQQHTAALPDYVGGRVLKVSGLAVVRIAEGVAQLSGDDMEVDYCTATFNQVRGSYDTSMSVRMVGGRVEVWGNPSHWSRLDNVFGLGLDDCVAVINRVLVSLDLPQFTPFKALGFTEGRDGLTHHHHGAQLSRVDMTCNLGAGMGRTRELLRWAAGQKLYRSSPSNPAEYGYESVYLATSGDWIGCKLYDKSLAVERRTGQELVKRVARLLKSGSISDDEARSMLEEGAAYLEKLTEWCAEVGLTRYELRFGRKFLEDRVYRGWVPGVCESGLIELAGVELDRLMERAVAVNENIEDSLTASELQAFTRWRRGLVVAESMPKTTYYRVRASIMTKTGHDIARPSVVSIDQPRPVFFRVKPLVLSSAPAWYRSPFDQSQLAA